MKRITHAFSNQRKRRKVQDTIPWSLGDNRRYCVLVQKVYLVKRNTSRNSFTISGAQIIEYNNFMTCIK
ncbi:hypothetical protein AD929_02505 [Gluconobacter potus]|uniref:Uncharacterized protein n=1 Tax=Gluconobacter potus TaxID=2724927 RepID=A0A149QYS1_9PROT|nr:hypothetical protein AD929_02505 [Gluconobacter potus]